jgi:hypothetical protein
MSDCLKTRKPLPGKGFRYLMLFLFIVDYRPLLPNTKLREDRSQDLFNPNLPRDACQRAYALAQMKRQQIAG